MPPSLLELVQNFKDDEAGCSDGSTDTDDDDYSGSETGEEGSDDDKSPGDSSDEEETEDDSDEPAGSKEEAAPDSDDDDDKPIDTKPKARPAAGKPEATSDGESSSSEEEDTMDTDFSAVKQEAEKSVKKATAPKPKKAAPERRVVSNDSFAGPAQSPSTFPCGIQTGQLATNKLAKILEERGVIPGHTEFPTTVTIKWITANPGRAVIYAPSGPKGYVLVPNKAGTKIDARAIKPADWIDTIDVGTADDLSVTPEFLALRPKPRKRKQDASTSAKPTPAATGSHEDSPSAASIQGAFKRAKVASTKSKEAETKTEGPKTKTTNEGATSAGAATKGSNKQQEDVAASATAKTGQASPSPAPMSTNHQGLGAASRESSASSRPSITIVESPADTGATNARGAKDATNTRGAAGPAPTSGTASGGAKKPPVKFSPEIIRGPNGLDGRAPNLDDNNSVVTVYYETPSASITFDSSGTVQSTTRAVSKFVSCRSIESTIQTLQALSRPESFVVKVFTPTAILEGPISWQTAIDFIKAN